jgi:hypothetical protein
LLTWHETVQKLSFQPRKDTAPRNIKIMVVAITPIAIKSNGCSMVTAALFPLMVATPDAVLDAVLVPVGADPVPLVAAAIAKPLAALKDVGTGL